MDRIKNGYLLQSVRRGLIWQCVKQGEDSIPAEVTDQGVLSDLSVGTWNGLEEEPMPHKDSHGGKKKMCDSKGYGFGEEWVKSDRYLGGMPSSRRDSEVVIGGCASILEPGRQGAIPASPSEMRAHVSCARFRPELSPFPSNQNAESNQGTGVGGKDLGGSSSDVRLCSHPSKGATDNDLPGAALRLRAQNHARLLALA